MRALALVLMALLVPQGSTMVTGVVTNAVTKAPVAGARVLLAPADGPLTAASVTSTDDRGRFTFAKVPPGTYRLLSGHDDYLRGEPSAPIVVAAGEPVQNLVVTMTPTAVISGLVMDEFGVPAGRVYVRAHTTKAVAEFRTNDLGEYRLFGLEPGSYVISAQRYAAPSIQGRGVVTPTPPCPDCRGEGTATYPLSGVLPNGGFIDPRALSGQTYPEVFYPGGTDRSAASEIKVAAGARIDGIDLRLIVR